jgi:uncharacterized protein (DUF1697 family)
MALVVFLKGVNVGGHRTFRPSTVAERLKRFDAISIGAAGTFVFRKAVGRSALRAAIRVLVPFKADVMICDGREIRDLVSQHPFAGQPARRDQVQFVGVRSSRRAPRQVPPFALPPTGRWGVRVVALHGPFVIGIHRREMRAIGHLGRMGQLLGGPVTMRSWTTMLRLARLLEADATIVS